LREWLGCIVLDLAFIPALGNLTHSAKYRGWFFNDPDWHPTSEEFNLTPMLWGTLLVMSTAVLVATPLGIASAVFCHYYAPLERETVSAFIELLAGIPSVVYGFWGLVVLVPIIGRIHPPGPSLLAGTLILTLMILPTITLVADGPENVPPDYLRGLRGAGTGTLGNGARCSFPGGFLRSVNWRHFGNGTGDW